MVYDLIEFFSSLILTYYPDDGKELPTLVPASFVNAFASPYPQSFSLPTAMIKHISLNSSRMYSQLVRRCKYFLSTHKIFVISYCQPTMDLNFKCDAFYLTPDQKLRWEVRKGKNHREFKLDLSTGIKLWVTREFYCRDDNPDVFMNSLKHIYRCDVISMNLSNQRLTEEIFSTLKFVEYLTIKNCVFEHSDGSLISYGELLSQTPSLTNFYCEDCSIGGSITTPDGSLLLLKGHCSLFICTKTLEDFNDFEAWCQFAKLNKKTTDTVPRFSFEHSENDNTKLEEVKKAVLKVFPDTDISKNVVSSNTTCFRFRAY